MFISLKQKHILPDLPFYLHSFDVFDIMILPFDYGISILNFLQVQYFFVILLILSDCSNNLNSKVTSLVMSVFFRYRADFNEIVYCNVLVQYVSYICFISRCTLVNIGFRKIFLKYWTQHIYLKGYQKKKIEERQIDDAKAIFITYREVNCMCNIMINSSVLACCNAIYSSHIFTGFIKSKQKISCL